MEICAVGVVVNGTTVAKDKIHHSGSCRHIDCRDKRIISASRLFHSHLRGTGPVIRAVVHNDRILAVKNSVGGAIAHRDGHTDDWYRRFKTPDLGVTRCRAIQVSRNPRELGRHFIRGAFPVLRGHRDRRREFLRLVVRDLQLSG